MKSVRLIRSALLAAGLALSCCACTACNCAMPGLSWRESALPAPTDGSHHLPVVYAAYRSPEPAPQAMPASPWRQETRSAEPARKDQAASQPAAQATAQTPSVADYQVDRTTWPPEGFAVAPQPDVMRLPPVDWSAGGARPVVGASYDELLEPSPEHIFPQPDALADPALQGGSPLIDPQGGAVLPPPYEYRYEQPGMGGRCLGALHEEWENIKTDYGNYYSWPTLRDMGLILAVTAPIANTAVDQNFRNWYQDDVRSTGTNNFASFWKPLGEGAYVIPGFLAVGIVGKCFDQQPFFHVAGELGDRTTRAYLVGAPPMIAMQYILGAGRPTTPISHPSYWRPFNDSHGVSGHAFMGAVPFITAAQMSDSLLMKSGFYVLSTFTAWSRINDDAHYLSQVILGWSMAYYACRAVDHTEANKNLLVLPVVSPGMTGMQVIYTF